MGTWREPPAEDAEFREIRRLFVREAVQGAAALRGLLDASGGVPAGEQGVRFRKIAHDLRGGGGSYGFPIVSLYAAEVEDTYREAGRPEALRALLGMLERSLEQAGGLVGVAKADLRAAC